MKDGTGRREPEPGERYELTTATGVVVPRHAIDWRFSRAGGPGGQHVNKADTRVELVCDLRELGGPPELVERIRGRLGDDLRIVAASERSQLANRKEAVRRLARRLEAASKTTAPRRPSRPSRSAVEARLEEKRRRSRRKADRRIPSDE